MTAFLAAAAFVAALVLVHRDPRNGVVVLLAGFLTSTDVVLWAHPVTVSVRRISLQPIDLALLAVFVPYALRRMRGELNGTLPKPLLVLLGLLLLETARGFESYGMQAVLNSDRRVAWFIGSAIYATSVTWDRKLGMRLAAVGAALLAFAMYGFATTGIHGADTARYVDGEYLPLRPLNAAGALMLLQTMTVAWFLSWRRRWMPRLLLAIGLPVLVLVQQRTVLVAAILIVPFLWAMWLSRLHRHNRDQGYALFGVTLLASPVAVWLLTRSHSLAATLHGASDNTGTLHWRIASWRAMLGLMSPSNWLIGSPAGRPETRYVLGQVTDVQAHSVYVEMLFRFGVPGVVALVAMWVFVFRRVRAADALPFPRWVGYSLVVSTMVFGLTYMLGLESGLWLGLLAGAVVAAGREPAHAAAITPLLSNTRGLSQPA